MQVYLNGVFVGRQEAAISPFDRGFLFGDGVYEGLRAFDGHVIAMERHIARMRDGLGQARIEFDPGVLAAVTEELLERNGLRDAFIYWQVTRGAPAPGQTVRTRVPDAPMKPTVFAYCVPTPGLSTYAAPATTRLRTVEDRRWLRGTLKSTSLLGNVLSVMDAIEQGAPDALLVRDGLVGEGSSTNVLLSLPDRRHGSRLVTPSLESTPILAGITRALVLDLMPEIEVRPVKVEELDEASEIMLLGTLSMVISVVELDGRPVGNGAIGPCARRVLARYIEGIRAEWTQGEGAWKAAGVKAGAAG